MWGIELDLEVVRVVVIGFVFMCAPKMTYFPSSDGLNLVLE